MYLAGTVFVLVVFGVDLSQQRRYLSDSEEFKNFQKKHVKSYLPDEVGKREGIFNKNMKNILQHNQDADSGRSTYRLGFNEYSDMSHEEFVKTMLGLEVPKDHKRKPFVASWPSRALPKQVNWRNQNRVTNVKNQNQCGACWAYAATGALEGAWAAHHGNLITLSEQQLVDCTLGMGNHGCHGGFPTVAFEYIIRNNGINSEQCYPYTGQEGSCNNRSICTGARMSSFREIPLGDENAQLHAVAFHGPIAVCIDAGQYDFQSYGGGIYNNPQCSQSVNHAVLLVGYGKENGNDYWYLKNSWGTTWGEGGYFKLARKGTNYCGITSLSSYPII